MQKQYTREYKPLTKGHYLMTELWIHNNQNHYEALKKCCFQRFTHITLNYFEQQNDKLVLKFFTLIPEYIDPSVYKGASDLDSACLFVDFVDYLYDGDLRAALPGVDNPIDFPAEKSYQDPTWLYPERVLKDLVQFIDELGGKYLTEGFPEGIIIGPKLLMNAGD